MAAGLAGTGNSLSDRLFLLPLTPPPARATLYSNDVYPRPVCARSGQFHYRENLLRAKTGGIDLPETGKTHPSGSPKLREAAQQF